MPGAIFPSDFSDTSYFQFRKVFMKNTHPTIRLSNAKIFGFNVKQSNIVKFALEKGPDGSPILDGSETTKNYLQPPRPVIASTVPIGSSIIVPVLLSNFIIYFVTSNASAFLPLNFILILLPGTICPLSTIKPK